MWASVGQLEAIVVPTDWRFLKQHNQGMSWDNKLAITRHNKMLIYQDTPCKIKYHTHPGTAPGRKLIISKEPGMLFFSLLLASIYSSASNLFLHTSFPSFTSSFYLSWVSWTWWVLVLGDCLGVQCNTDDKVPGYTFQVECHCLHRHMKLCGGPESQAHLFTGSAMCHTSPNSPLLSFWHSSLSFLMFCSLAHFRIFLLSYSPNSLYIFTSLRVWFSSPK